VKNSRYFTQEMQWSKFLKAGSDGSEKLKITPLLSFPICRLLIRQIGNLRSRGNSSWWLLKCSSIMFGLDDSGAAHWDCNIEEILCTWQLLLVAAWMARRLMRNGRAISFRGVVLVRMSLSSSEKSFHGIISSSFSVSVRWRETFGCGIAWFWVHEPANLCSRSARNRGHVRLAEPPTNVTSEKICR
jgi:hypothetical protein